MAYGEPNGHMIDDVMWPIAGGRRCVRLAEVAVSKTASTYIKVTGVCLLIWQE